MALINCPNCGKPVSDTVDNCIYCGCSLKRNDEQERHDETDYASLTPSAKMALEREYDSIHPKHAKYRDYTVGGKKLKLIHSLVYSLIFVGFAVLILGAVILENLTICVIGAAVFIIGDVGEVVVELLNRVILIRIYKKKSLIVLKKYCKWLADEKGITYKVEFSSAERRWKKFYDEINVERDDV